MWRLQIYGLKAAQTLFYNRVKCNTERINEINCVTELDLTEQ